MTLADRPEGLKQKKLHESFSRVGDPTNPNPTDQHIIGQAAQPGLTALISELDALRVELARARLDHANEATAHAHSRAELARLHLHTTMLTLQSKYLSKDDVINRIDLAERRVHYIDTKVNKIAHKVEYKMAREDVQAE